MNGKLTALCAATSATALLSASLPSLFRGDLFGSHNSSISLREHSFPPHQHRNSEGIDEDPFAKERAEFIKQTDALREQVKALQGTDREQVAQIEGLNRRLQELREAHITLINESNADRELLNTLAAQLTKLQEEKLERLKPVKLRVQFRILDVYLDGSPGKDTWSVHANVNGLDLGIWRRKRDISDDGTEGNGPGPGGDKNCSRYSLDKFIDIEVPGDGEFQVKFKGTAHDRDRPINESSMTFSRANGWGLNGNGHHLGGTLNRMGAAGRNTEYWVFFNVSSR